jgi:hypothetical protein
MSLDQLCDLAYAMMVEKLEKRFQAVEIANYIAKANGGEGDPPRFSAEVERFDKWLYAELEGDTKKDVVKRFYGVG